MVPVDSVDEVIRPVISKNAVSKKVFPIFKEKPEEAGTNWSRWYKVLTEKMTSGDVIQVAEVVRDLTHAQINKGICLLYTSPSPRDLSTSRMPSSA